MRSIASGSTEKCSPLRQVTAITERSFRSGGAADPGGAPDEGVAPIGGNGADLKPNRRASPVGATSEADAPSFARG
jgi:hypothetical protein